MKMITIAIDGPAAAGKSTVAKEIAKRLNYTYIDTGAMYRAFTYAILKKGLDPKNHKQSISLVGEVEIILEPSGKVMLNNEDVTEQIRTPFVSGYVSYVASYKEIRLFLVDQQRKMAEKTNVVMDGRDIGTYVLPQADVKIFQIASVETRAIRRYEENLGKGIVCTLDEIEQDVRNRDYIDSNREFAPLKAASDSILIDTSFMTVNEVVEEIIMIINNKKKEL